MVYVCVALWQMFLVYVAPLSPSAHPFPVVSFSPSYYVWILIMLHCLYLYYLLL